MAAEENVIVDVDVEAIKSSRADQVGFTPYVTKRSLSRARRF